MAPVSVVAVTAESTVLQAWRGRAPRALQAGVLLRSRPRPRSRVAPMPIEGSAVEKVRRVGSPVAGAAPDTSAQDAAGSHSDDTVLGDGGAVTRVGGWDFGHSCCAAWWPDAV